MEKVLIIKLGYSETLDPEIGKLPSLGDVMRTTVILNAFKGNHITWLTDETAYLLLKDNPLIDRILFYDLTTVLQLQNERFDVVINLEKVPGICALTDRIKAWVRYGFRFDDWNAEAKPYDGAQEIFTTYNNIRTKRIANRKWQEVLYEMVNRKWDNEEYVLGYKPTSKLIYGIGLNYRVGSKWPNKAWPMHKWDALFKLLKANKYEVSTQEGTNNLEDYLNWIHSCELIVTNDSLGLHLAIAMDKKIVALFGPTSPHEVHLYGLGSKIIPDCNYDCIPCMKQRCKKKVPCMETIEVERVFEEIRRVFKSERDRNAE